MIILKNQTLYKCSYCGQRKLSRKGCFLHENYYCQNELSPHMIGEEEKKRNCPHNNTETRYRYIPGEAVKEPDYISCLDCGARVNPCRDYPC